jgi:hypothetical protein
MTSYVFYGDESGNSGGGFFDAEQPIFVLALVGWPVDKEAAVLQEYKNVCALHGRAPSPTVLTPDGAVSKESKAEKLLARKSGQMFCASLMDMLLRLDLPCAFGITEKRFLVTAMLVETFLDPTYNDLAPDQGHAELRKRIAGEIYKLFDDALLKSFSSATRSDNLQAIAQIGMQLAERLRLHVDPEIAHLAAAIAHGASRPFRFGEEQPDTPKKSNRPHPGIQTLFPTMCHIEPMLQFLDANARIIVDEEGPWDDVKKHGFKTMVAEQNPFFVEIGLPPISRIQAFDTANSKNYFGIQLADILAGALMRGCRHYLKGEKDLLVDPVYDRLAKIFRRFSPPPFVAAQDTASILGWAAGDTGSV